MPATVSLPCLCANVRRAARALTQLYDDALRPLELRATQFTVLQALSLSGEVSQKELGDLLVMDSTSLTRTLRLLQARGWIEDRRGNDRRERRLRLSAAGRRQLQRAMPRWEAIQTRIRSRVGKARWREFLEIPIGLTDVVKNLE